MKKKVLQIGGNLRINGISSFIMTLFRNMNKEYEFIFINTAKGKDYYKEEIESLGGKIYQIDVKGKGLLRSVRQAREIREIIKIEKPDVVHSHYYSNNGLYLKQAYLENVPVRISHCHQSNPNNLSIGKKIAKFFSSRMIEKYANYKIGCSETARKFLYGKSGECIYNTVDYSRFDKINNDIWDKYDLDKSKAYFSFVGRFAKQKNIPFLLEVFNDLKENKNIELLMIGHGCLEDYIKNYIVQNNIKSIRLLPPNTNVGEILSISNGFLLPSLWEGFSITLIEAQAVGVKCLASNKITTEAQQGLIDFIPLEKEKWCQEIIKLAKRKNDLLPIRNQEYDVKNQVSIFDGIYSNISSDEWIARGKEYSLGSSRFYRNKWLSFNCFKRAHLAGNLRGTFYYALGFFEGNGIAKNVMKAQSLVNNIMEEVCKKAEMKIPEFILILADMYSFGLGKKNDYIKAFELYYEAAKLGNLEAMCDLGYMYLVGQGVVQNKEQSCYWFKKSADLGYVHSMRDIGQNYMNGEGTNRNMSEAMKYFEMASKHNYSHGTADLAMCYLNGDGVEKNETKAIELYKLAYKQDAERAFRDLVNLDIDIEELLNNSQLIYNNTLEIKEINNKNTFDGVLYISEKIEKIDPACFYNSNVKKIFVEKNNKYFSSLAGILFSKDKTKLIRYPLKSSLTCYKIPDSVTTVGCHAFQNSRNLVEIFTNNNIQYIKDSAFDDCKQLSSFEMPANVIEIGSWAFHGCDKISWFFIPKSVKIIGTYALGSCESLNEIKVDQLNKYYISYNGNLYTKDMITLLQYCIGKKDKSFVLPNQTKKVEFRALSDAFNLETIDLNNCEFVEKKGMYYCTNLKKIIYKCETKIGDKALDFTNENLIKEPR